MSAMHISQPENGKETIYRVVKKRKISKDKSKTSRRKKRESVLQMRTSRSFC